MSVPAHPKNQRGPALSFRSVGFEAGRRVILKDISLDAEPGEVLCLLGPSGSGKTSLLRIAAGIERQTAGQVAIDGQEVAGPDLFVPPEGRSVGLMFQDFALFPHMTLAQNVRYGLHEFSVADAKREAAVALERVGLSAMSEAYPHQLSGGEQQRVALARALAPRPRVLLMDEPFSGLDSRLKDHVRTETLRILREIGASAIVVTHDPEEAMRMGDRIALMREGALVQVGDARAIHGQPADLFTAAFLSEINVLPGIVQAGRVETPLGVVAASPRSDGTRVDVAVRSSGVRAGIDPAGVRAKVLERRFLGSVEQVLFGLEGLNEPFRARLRPGELANDVHDVFVAVDPAETFVFERTEGSV